MDAECQPNLYDELVPTISDQRLSTYMVAAGYEKEKALKLYVWNALVGEAFHLPIQAVEVGLRNRINGAFCRVFGESWWAEREFLRLVEREGTADIENALRRIDHRKKPRVTGQVVATLSFGFWVGALQPRFNPPVWSNQLSEAFPALPHGKTRYDVAAIAKQIADLRNRIWHHEPLIRLDLSKEFSDVMKLLSWICSTKAGWIRPQCRVPQLLRQKP